jgi:hypothetical protein
MSDFDYQILEALIRTYGLQAVIDRAKEISASEEKDDGPA